MRDATGDIQSALFLGANSDIAAAVIDNLAARRLRRLVLAARDTVTAEQRAEGWRSSGIEVGVIAYDALDPAAHDQALHDAGAVDAIFVAFGDLGTTFDLDTPAVEVARLAEVNFGAAATASARAAAHLRSQGHGSLVIFSSVAGVRVRPENAVYGAAKAGLDAFGSALADMVHGSGVHVMVVRPGFVHTKMTAGRDEAPFATTAEAVAADVVEGLRRSRRVVWSPRILREVFGGLRTLPGPLWRRVAG